MGLPVSKTFTVPPGGCLVQATVSFEASISGSGVSDFGSSDGYLIALTEYLSDGVTYVSSEGTSIKPIAVARAKYGDIYSSSYVLPAGHVVTVGLSITTATSHTMTIWNAALRVELIKR